MRRRQVSVPVVDQTGSTAYPSLCLYNWGSLRLDTGGTIYSMAQTHVFPRLALDGKPQLVTVDGLTCIRANYLVSKDPSFNPYYGYVWCKEATALGM